MGVPATLLLMQVTRGYGGFGGGGPPDPEPTPEEKRRRQRIMIGVAVFCGILVGSAIAYCLYEMHQSALQLKVMYAQTTNHKQ